MDSLSPGSIRTTTRNAEQDNTNPDLAEVTSPQRYVHVLPSRSGQALGSPAAGAVLLRLVQRADTRASHPGFASPSLVLFPLKNNSEAPFKRPQWTSSWQPLPAAPR